MAVVRPRTIGPAPVRAETKWQAAGDSFFASRCKAEGGGKKLATDVAGRRTRRRLRRRSSVRPMPFEDADGAPKQEPREYGHGDSPAPRRDRRRRCMDYVGAVFPPAIKALHLVTSESLRTGPCLDPRQCSRVRCDPMTVARLCDTPRQYGRTGRPHAGRLPNQAGGKSYNPSWTCHGDSDDPGLPRTGRVGLAAKWPPPPFALWD